MKANCWLGAVLLALLLLNARAFADGNPEFSGTWKLIPDLSTEIDLYATLTIDVTLKENGVLLVQTWGTSRRFVDSLDLRTDGVAIKVPVKNRVFPTNVFMGLAMPVGSERELVAHWENGGSVLKLRESFTVRGSQGLSQVACTHTYELREGGDILIYEIVRSSRPGHTLHYVLKKAGRREAYYYKLQDNWEVAGKLPEQALLISLQGIVNTTGPRLYLIYPETWPFHYVVPVFEFYQKKRYFTFTQLKSLNEALETFRDVPKGYVVWDPAVRTSLIVAFTVAGVEKAVVVTEQFVPLVESYGLHMVEDLRGKFHGMNDAQIYQWAYDRYWDRCSRDFIIWLGGDAGPVMKPGVADWGVCKRAFFNDLSTRPEDEEEYALARKLLSQMNPMSMVMGWHSYAKDKERDHVTLTSSFGLRVEGLHTIPNLSFSHQVQPTPGFVFKNNHHVVPGKRYKPKKKVYITCIQTDGMGIGAWNRPGRGEIPYAWEVITNRLWMEPAVQEYFYTTATPNDYFLGALSGPGYLYPKAVPPHMLPGLIAMAKDFMEKHDLRVFEIMDYSEGATVEGNTELTKEVVEAYYKGMPDAIGFVNGYAPSYTFAIKDGRPLISYDYYLSPTKPEDEAVEDLKELAAINKKRPYFLLMHVRESSDVKRVKRILEKLPKEFEVVPLDLFLAMAGTEPTFQERFLAK
ncbi:MAG: GxGYxYP family putative glycoside hydrolase [candidate division KSB1 bacterium]|nr:GxGYxYP family putative glycoside hydrolase [candidate division KSB1 bacterium]